MHLKKSLFPGGGIWQTHLTVNQTPKGLGVRGPPWEPTLFGIFDIPNLDQCIELF